jgi:hypothetical protein
LWRQAHYLWQACQNYRIPHSTPEKKQAIESVFCHRFIMCFNLVEEGLVGIVRAIDVWCTWLEILKKVQDFQRSDLLYWCVGITFSCFRRDLKVSSWVRSVWARSHSHFLQSFLR